MSIARAFLRPRDISSSSKPGRLLSNKWSLRLYTWSTPFSWDTSYHSCVRDGDPSSEGFECFPRFPRLAYSSWSHLDDWCCLLDMVDNSFFIVKQDIQRYINRLHVSLYVSSFHGMLIDAGSYRHISDVSNESGYARISRSSRSVATYLGCSSASIQRVGLIELDISLIAKAQSLSERSLQHSNLTFTLHSQQSFNSTLKHSSYHLYLVLALIFESPQYLLLRI